MTFYTDGSCLANGKKGAKGGYGIVGVDENDSVQFVRSKRTEGTTNNREELKAILYIMESNVMIGVSLQLYIATPHTV